MISVYESAKEHEYFATYFKRMLDEHGGVETAKRLLAKKEPQEWLFKLWELGILDQSVEAKVIEERFQPLFSEAEIQEARRQLEELGYLKGE
jgi:hypothetical protein